MGKMVEEASKAAFHEWGKRHEKGLILWHRTKIAVGWGITALVAGFVIAHTYGPTFAMPSVDLRWIGIIAAALAVVFIVAVTVIATTVRRGGSLRIPPRPAELLEDEE
jgi:hypothetical protein